MGNKVERTDVLKSQILTKPIISLDNDGHHPKPLQILIQPNIGLESDVRHPIVEILNNSLANESVLSQKTRSAHWNASGSGFFELHILFETQYKQLDEIADKIAERTRILGGMAIASFKEFLAHSRLEEDPAKVPDFCTFWQTMKPSSASCARIFEKCSEEYEDEGTVELMVGVMSLHEKMAWMLRSYIENEPVNGESQKRKQLDE